MAASYQLLPSLSLKTLAFPKVSSSLSLSLSPGSIKPKKPITLSASFSLLSKQSKNLRPFFVRNVAVSSKYEQGEEEDVSEEETNSYSDLKLYVGNLPFRVDSSDLAGLFVRAGNVQMVEVIYDRATGRSRGFGFVTMSTLEEVHAAEQQFNGYELDGRPLRVNSRPPPRRDDLSSRGFRVGGVEAANREHDGRPLRVNSGPPPRRDDHSSRGFRAGGFVETANRVYVGNLSWGVDDVALESLFSEQGKVMEAKVVYDKESGRSRGFGFVTYSSAEGVNKAISSLNGVDLKGRSIQVSMAEARPRRQF